VIQSFADTTTQDIFDDEDSKAARRIPKDLWPVVRRKLDALDAAISTEDLRCTPGHHFKHLKREWKGYCSIRVNDQYRIIFRFENGHAHEVSCRDPHS
jgi:proteic killer suppression protein